MATRRTKKTPDKQTSRSYWGLFWILFFLFMLILFVANFGTIQSVLRKTGFLESLQQTPSPTGAVGTAAPTSASPSPAPTLASTPSASPVATLSPSPSPAPSKTPLPSARPSLTPASPRPTSSPVVLRSITIQLVKVKDDGSMDLVPVTRMVPSTQSPLSLTMQSLFAGPVAAERGKGILTLIPAQTRLRSVSIQGSTAFVDVSESFRFNPYGADGLRMQVKQIVYTATAFATVRKVQLLIEGKTVQYLATEGMFVGKPLGREDF